MMRRNPVRYRAVKGALLMLKYLGAYLKPFRKNLILGPAFKMAEAVFELIVPLVMARIIDDGIRGPGGPDQPFIGKMGLLLVILGITGLICALICQYFAAKASQGFGTLMRSGLYRHIGTLSHAQIDRFGTSSLITRLNNDVNQMQTAVAMLIRLVFRAPFLAIGATVMAMTLDMQMSVIFILSAVLIAAVLYLVMSRCVPIYTLIQKLLDKLSLITGESLSGMRVIRAFSKQAAEQERFDHTAEQLRRTAMKVTRLSSLLTPATTVLVNLAIMAIIWFGGLRVQAGTLSQGQIIALWNYMTQILLALIVVANLVVIFTKAFASAKRVGEVFAVSADIADSGNGPVVPVQGAAKIAFEQVSFSYSAEDGQCLFDLEFSLSPGQSVGIIGGTGSGKSTLVALIPRFYEVDSGRVKIDGVDVRDYPLTQLREKIGLVPQRALLFSGTIRSNLAWGNREANEQDMWQALEIAQAAEFVRQLPDGLDAPVSQGGGNFSGGQRQRLTIARALIRRPEILILDDSASALDFATDAALRQALAQQMGDTTRILISQRANTVKSADLILVLDGGQIVGAGTHRQLFDQCEIYREICLSQLSAEEAKRA